MIYRAFDCGIYDGNEPLTTVWFDASGDKEARERIIALLALVWNVDPEQVFSGNVDSTVDIERDSIQDAAAGDQRWMESGRWGELPLYFDGPTLVLTNVRHRRQLRAAAVAAKKHAIELAEALEFGGTSHRHATYETEQYKAFGLSPWLAELEENELAAR